MSRRWTLAALALAWVVAGCGGENEPEGARPPPWLPPPSGGQDAGGDDTPFDGGAALRPFSPPGDPGPGGILFAASGEVLALTGYPFPPVNDGDAVFVDGWDVRFSHVLVTLDAITLSENPDRVPGDPSQTGAVVAEVDGPWAVDLARRDPGYLPGKGGPGEQAVAIASLTGQNRNGDRPFETDGTRYAFGYRTVAATAAAANVNLSGEARVDYAEAIASGCTVLYVGTATFEGGTVPGHADCNSDPAYASWPKSVDFRLCFRTPSDYVNCQNPDNDPAAPFPEEEHRRGIAFKSNQSVIGQLTLHTDHPFWDSVLHGSPAHFDQLAAQALGQDAGRPTVTLESLRGVDYTAITDALGHELRWRYCIDPPTDVHPPLAGVMSFDPESVPHAIGGDPATGLRDLYDFATYAQSTQAHLNSDGLCFVRRGYPSPP